MQKVEYLRFDMHRNAIAQDFAPVYVDQNVSEFKQHIETPALKRITSKPLAKIKDIQVFVEICAVRLVCSIGRTHCRYRQR
jgi:hypothetical protein